MSRVPRSSLPTLRLALCAAGWLVAALAVAQSPALRLHFHSGHASGVTALAFAPDGHLLASGSYDHTVRLWDLPSGREVAVLGTDGAARALRFTPDGRTLAARTDHSVVLIDLTQVAVSRVVELGYGLRAADLASDGSLLAALHDGQASWIRGEQRTAVPAEDVRSIFALAEHRALTIDSSGKGVVWALGATPTAQQSASLGAGTAAISADRTRLAILRPDGAVAVFALPALTSVAVVPSRGLPLAALALSGDGRRLFTSGGTAADPFRWNAQTIELGDPEAPVGTFYVEPGTETLAASPDGSILGRSSFASPGELWLADAITGELAIPLELPTGRGQAIAADREGQTLGVARSGRAPVLWRLRDGEGHLALHSSGHEPPLEGIPAFDGNLTAVAKPNGRGVEVRTGVFATRSYLVDASAPPVDRVAVSADARTVFATRGGTLEAGDLRTGTRRFRVEAHAGVIKTFTVSAQARKVATVSGLEPIAIWDAASGKRMGDLPQPNAKRGVLSLAFDEQGEHLFAGGMDGTLTEWTLASGARRTFKPGIGFITTITPSAREPLVVVGGPSGKLAALDLKSGEVRQQFDVQGWISGAALLETPVPALAVSLAHEAAVPLFRWDTGALLGFLLWFDHDGWMVFAADGRYDAPFPMDRWMYRVRGLRPVPSAEAPTLRRSPGLLSELLGIPVKARSKTPELTVQTGHPSSISSLEFARGQDLLLSTSGGSEASQLRAWDASSGRQRWAHDADVRSAPHFTPDGRRVAYCGARTLVFLSAISGEPGSSVALSCSALAFSPDGRLVYTSGPDGVTSTDLATGVRVARLPSRVRPGALAISDDGRWLAGTTGNSLTVWDVQRGTHQELARVGDFYSALRFRPGTSVLAAGTFSGLVELWEVAEARRIAFTQADPYWYRGISSLAFSRDGKRLLADNGTYDGIPEFDEQLEHKKLWRASRDMVGASEVAISDSGLVVTSTEGKDLDVWDLASGARLQSLHAWANGLSDAVAHPREPLIVFHTDDGAKMLDLRTGVLRTVNEAGMPLDRYAFTAEGDLYALGNREVRSLSLDDRPPRTPSYRWQLPLSRVARSSRGDVAGTLQQWQLTGTPDGMPPATSDPAFLVVQSGDKERWRAELGPVSLSDPRFSPGGSVVAIATQLPSERAPEKRQAALQLFKVANGARLPRIERFVDAFDFLDDKTAVVASSFGYAGELLTVQLETGKERLLALTAGQSVTKLRVTPDRKTVVVGDASGRVLAYDLRSGERRMEVQAHREGVSSLAVTADGRFIVSTASDLTARFIELASGLVVGTFVSLGDTDFVLATDEGYLATRGVNRGIAFRQDGEVYPLEQFDLELNHPDRVLARLGYADEATLATYQKLRAKRVARLAPRGPGEAKPPTVAVPQPPPAATTTRALVLPAQISAGDQSVARLHVFVNDVPVFGREGLRSEVRPGSSVEVPVELTLGMGRNKLQLVAVDTEGRESLRWTRDVSYTGAPATRTLHVVAVGVSRYQNPRYDLEFAAKDAADQAAYFESLRTQDREVRVTRLLDKDATQQRILALRDQLLATSVDDQVVVFVAGHGVLDRELDYYFAPTDFDLAAPAEHGLTFAQLEGLLDGIPARQKLLMLDTCHAGEVDREEWLARATPGDGRVKKKSTRALALEEDPKAGPKRSASTRRPPRRVLPPDLFLDLRRGTGATVIVASGAAEYAFEAPRWNNGVFTYAVLNGLGGKADGNGDRRVDIGELRAFVTDQVTTLTGGQQRPATRGENLELSVLVDTGTFDRDAITGSPRDPFTQCTAQQAPDGTTLQCGRLLAVFPKDASAEAVLAAMTSPDRLAVRSRKQTRLRLPSGEVSAARVSLTAKEAPAWQSAEALISELPGKRPVLCFALDGDAPTIGRCERMLEVFSETGLPALPAPAPN